MAKHLFNSKTATEAGAKGKRGKSLTVQVLKATKDGSIIVKVLVEIMMDKKNRSADRIKAAQTLLDRGYGKPIQQVDASMEGTITFSWEGDDISIST